MDIPDIAERVINVHTTRPYEFVLNNVLSVAKCGKRNRELLWKSQDRGDGTHNTHFFIEFAHKYSVPLAQQAASAYPGVTIHCLSRNLNMIGTFDCLAKGIEPPRKRPLSETERDGSALPDRPRDPLPLRSLNSQVPLGPSSSKKQRIHENAGNGSAPPAWTAAAFRQPLPPYQAHDDAQRKLPYNPTKQPWNQLNNTAEHRRIQSDTNNYQQHRLHNRASTHSTSVSRSPTRRTPYDYNEQVQDPYPSQRNDIGFREKRLRRQSDASYYSSTSYERGRTPTRRSSPMGPLSSDIIRLADDFQHKFELKIPDAEKLGEGDVPSVIDLLVQSSMGPDAWMTVAATYRRKSLHRAALTIVGAMLEVMAKRGMDKSDLKPALLLMAQCHYSIAKEEGKKVGDNHKQESDKYFVTLLDWLRQTYGPYTPAVNAISQANSKGIDNSNGPLSATEVDIKPFANHGLPARPNDPVLPPSLPTPLSVVEAATARYKAVTEQLAQLRREKADAEVEVERARQRRLEAEDALRDETAKRRRTEQDLREARADERLAATRAQREADVRKDAEERLAQERQLAQRHTNEAKDEAARVVVQDLAKILTFASRTPVSTLDSLRSFCEARARGERILPGVPP